MDGQIEGLTIGDQEVGLWNYADAQEIQGAPGRNKFKKTAETSVRYVQYNKRLNFALNLNKCSNYTVTFDTGLFTQLFLLYHKVPFVLPLYKKASYQWL